jgi:nucleoside-diphosphate-sugar epimerase
MKTILITGINGFLGSNLAKEFSANYNIIGLGYSIDNLFRFEGYQFKIYSTQSDNWEILFEVDIIIHTATLYGRNKEDLQKIVQTNLFMPFKLLDCAVKSDVAVFVNTDTVLDRFVSPYALTKRQFQEWLYSRRNEIKVINMQLEHFYGPGCSSANFITSMIERLKRNEPSIDLTLGEQQRAFVYISDVVAAYNTVIQKARQLPDSYTSFQVTTKQIISIRELMIYLKEVTGSSTILNFGVIPYRENELMHSETDNAALSILGWEPAFSISEGLKVIALNNEGF